MGLVYSFKETEEAKLYEAYGMIVYGNVNKYTWTIYPDRPDEEVYTSIRIEKDGEDIANEKLGNRCIFKEVFERTIDNFLWWLDQDKPDPYDVERMILKSLCENNSLFNYRIESRKQKMLEKYRENERVEKRKIQMKELFHQLQSICDKKKWLLYQHGDYPYCDCYIFKAKNKRAKEYILDAIAADKSNRIKSFADFAKKHADNTDVELIAFGYIEDVVNMLKEKGVKL